MQGSIIEKLKTQDKGVRAQSSMPTKISPRMSSKNRVYLQAYALLILGIAVFLFFKHLIPGNEVFPEYIIAIGIALIGIAFMARRGYVGAGAVTPGILVLGVGLIEYWLISGYSIGSLTTDRFITFMLSFWLPSIGLLILGVIYLLVSMRKL
jgi:hypothetical protein